MGSNLLDEDGLLSTAGKTLWQLIAERGSATPDKVMAFDERGRTLTYGGYVGWCERVAAGFAAMGIGEGSRVSWMLPSRIETLVVAGALARLGATQNPMLPIYRHKETSFIVRQTQAVLLIVPGLFRNFDYPAMARECVDGTNTRVLVVDPDLPEGDPRVLGGAPSDPSTLRWIFYSSGTTADPKGALHTDLSISAANNGMQWSLGCRPDDRTAVVFPLTHVGGLVWLFNTMQTGVELLMVETFNAETTPLWLGEHGVTCAGAGTIFWMAYLAAQRKHPERRIMPEVRLFNGGGAPKPPPLHYELRDEMGAPMISGWGLTESPIVTMAHPGDADEKLANTEGRAVPGAQLRTVTLEGHVGATGEEGELQVKAPQVCLGYLDSSLDAEAFTADGWFRTGDLGVIDAEGYVRITGRLKDIIIRKGENISAKEVEDAIYSHPKVADVAVVGLPDSALGEMCCAVVVCHGGAPLSFAEMVSHLKDLRLSTQKIPERLEIVASLPRNPSGKVLKFELRKTFGAPVS